MATSYSYAGYNIYKSILSLKAYKNTINDKSDIKRVKNKIISEINNMIRMIYELKDILDTNPTSFNKDNLIRLEEDINNVAIVINELETHKEAIEMINILLEHEDDGFEVINKYDFRYYIYNLTNSSVGEDENLNSNDWNIILNNLTINRDINIYIPRAREGMSLYYLYKEFNKINPNNFNITSYASENEDYNLQCIKQYANRTIKGMGIGSRISNDVFDVVYLCPEISWLYSLNELGQLRDKKEKIMIKDQIKHLRKDGLFILNIPYYRLTKDIIILLSKQLTNISVIKKTQNDITNTQDILIIGTKNTTPDIKEDVYNYLSSIKLKDISYQLNKQYTLASGGIKEPELFRGSALDVSELESIVKNDTLMESFFKKQEIETNEQNARPLMPFNMGQIGLVLTSGCLDGTVEEYEGQYHAIKGMVTKIKHEDSDIDNNEESILETISNKVQINIVTPDGKFIELA